MSLPNIFDDDVKRFVHGYDAIDQLRGPANEREIARKGTIGQAQGKGSSF